MANGRYYEAGTVAGGSDEIDILTNGGFKASQIMIANDHASTACTVQAGAVNAYSVQAGEVLRLVGSFSVITVVDATNVVPYRVYAAEEVAPALNLEKNGGTSAISDLSVTTGKLAADCVTNAKVADLAIDTEHLAALAVETAKINTAAVTEAKIVAYAPAPSQLNVARVAMIDIDYTDIELFAGTPFAVGPTFPDNSIVTRAFYVVDDTFTSATDAATIGIGFATDDVNGIVASTAISAGGSVWDAANHECIQTGTAANFGVQLTAARQLSISRAGAEDLTAGHLTLYVEYVVGA